MRKHSAPIRCKIKHELGIISPSRLFLDCRYGQTNDQGKCINCRHNKRERKEHESRV